MNYPLEQLSPEKFQEFSQALLLREYKNTQCYPIGQPDGGRDAISYIPHRDSKGFIIFQVKFFRDPASFATERLKLLSALKDELPKVEALKVRGAKQFVLITNAPGTAHLGVGSIDKVQAALDSMPIPAICWWRDDINRRLDSAYDLKWSYPELMTGPDLIRTIIESGLTEHQQRRSSAIHACLAHDHGRDSEVKFKQVELQNKLLDLFIDVPVAFPKTLSTRKLRKEMQLAFVGAMADSYDYIARERLGHFEVADDVAYYSHQLSEDDGVGAATLILHSAGQQYIERCVIEGAPGQGKSTITQYVCQVHRMRLLESVDLSLLPDAHRNCPVRLPFRIDLRDLATWLDRRDPFSIDDDNPEPAHWHKSLESFLAAQIRYSSGGAEFSVNDLLAVFRLSATLVIFDGLDEVAQIKQRQAVVDEIVDGSKRLSAQCASLQVLVTSRPAAFANSPGLPVETFPYLELGSVNRKLIDEYAGKWLRARKLSGTEASDVRRILKDKLDSPHLRDLARNPMQLAILLSLIHTRGASLPDKRTALYDSYVELFFNREAEKSRIVRDNRVVLIDIHRYLAWILHVRAESPKRGGSIREDELHELLRKYLVSQGHKQALLEELFAGMVERVVAIISRVQGTYEFEVQPLREYFAARYLYESAPYSPPGKETKGTLLDRFDALARNFYWLNVTRFYAGCYSAGELPSLITGLDTLIESDDFKNTSHPRVLGSMLLADWVFTQHPRSVRRVVKLILDGPGMRVILANNNRRATQAAALILPNGGGREEVLDRAFELLRATSAAEFAFDLVKLIAQNRGAADVRDKWSREVSRRKGDKRTFWIELGIRLGYFSVMADSELEKIFSDADFNVDRVRQLLRAHRLDWLESNETRIVAAVECIAENRIASDPNSTSKHVLETFVRPMDLNTYSALMHLILNERHFSHANERREITFEVEQSTSPSGMVSEMIVFCSKVCEIAQEQFKKPLPEWTNSLVPWTAIVESIRLRLGDRPALFGIAAISAGIKSEDSCAEASSLFDENVELCRRARFARQKAGMLGWWLEQLDAAKTANQSYLAIALASIWTGRATFQQLMPILDRKCKELDMRIWSGLANTISTVISHGSSRASRRHISIDEIPSDAGERILVLASLRLPDDQQCRLFKERLIDYRGNDNVVLRFCQNQAYESLLFGVGERKRELAMIEHCYEHGILLTSRAFRRFSNQRQKTLGRNFVELIVANTDKYPAELVALAEASRQAELGKRVQSVGAVAKSEAWFVEARW